MNEILDAVRAWPLWDISWAEWAVLGALLIVVLQHGGTAGIHAAMGRDGLLDHRPAELRGAIRGTVTLVALMAPVFVIWGLDALSSAERLDVYLQANWAIIAVYGPVTLIALASFVLARTMPWRVGSNLNSVVIGTLELIRPWIAAAGMVAGVIVTRDVVVAGIGTAAVIAGILVAPATRRWWYARPVRLADLGADPASDRQP